MPKQELCLPEMDQAPSVAPTDAKVIHLETKTGYTGFPAGFKFYSKDPGFFDLSNQAKAIPLLNREEEIMLARAIKRGDQDARAELWLRNVRLAMDIAYGYLGRGLPYPELQAAGFEGILKAIKKYDPDKFGTKFSTYATPWIKQTVRRAVHNEGNLVRIPVHAQELNGQITAVEKFLITKLQRDPTAEELAEELGNPKVNAETITENVDLVKRAKKVMSLDSPVGNESEKPLIDSVKEEFSTLTPEGKYYTPEQEVLAEQTAQNIKADVDKVMEILSAREKRVLELIFGLNGGTQHTLDEAGKKLGVSRERIRQVKDKAICKMHASGYAKLLRIYLED